MREELGRRREKKDIFNSIHHVILYNKITVLKYQQHRLHPKPYYAFQAMQYISIVFDLIRLFLKQKEK